MNIATDRLSVSAVTASVLLFQAEHKLPDPIKFSVTSRTGFLNLDFTTVEELTAWNEALEADALLSQAYSHDDEPKTLHNFSTRRWGWFVYMTALVPVVAQAEPLPTDTLAKLAEVAA
jgi:hypothetical protein